MRAEATVIAKDNDNARCRSHCAASEAAASVGGIVSVAVGVLDEEQALRIGGQTKNEFDRSDISVSAAGGLAISDKLGAPPIAERH